MGRPKVKIIDDSLPKEEVKKAKKGTTDTLVESLKAELGIKDEAPKKPSFAKATEGKETKEAKKVLPKQGKTKYRSKKYQAVIKDFDKTRKLPLNEAVALVQKTSYTKFPGTVEAHINTNQKNIRGLVNLPFATGRKLRILAFPSTTSASQFGPELTAEGLSTSPLRTSGLKEFEETGIIIGDDKTLEEIEKGKINFDVLVTTPEWMPKLAKVAKVLGPKGLMPNPKNGTITDNLKRVVTELQAGKIEYKTESNGQIIHLAIGKVTQPSDEIAANVKTLFSTVGKTKITKITLSPTMGPGVKIDLSSI